MHHSNKREETDLVDLIEQANLSLLQYLNSSAERVKKQHEHESVK